MPPLARSCLVTPICTQGTTPPELLREVEVAAVEGMTMMRLVYRRELLQGLCHHHHHLPLLVGSRDLCLHLGGRQQQHLPLPLHKDQHQYSQPLGGRQQQHLPLPLHKDQLMKINHNNSLVLTSVVMSIIITEALDRMLISNISNSSLVTATTAVTADGKQQ